ncbi:hypothetical protein [Micromonospora sp. NPDC047730]|uniref:hypothetical protein n=1 Tax=Micromonospora sp. NPDC047730 TaxID=3364253 RepID=UPI00371D9E29
MRQWLEDAWAHVRVARILSEGEGGPPLPDRDVLAEVADSTALEKLRTLTTSGEVLEDICRCPGDLTLALYDADDVLIGSASVHPGAIAWQRDRFGVDLATSNSIDLELFLSELGVQGGSRSLLSEMITALELDEGDVQFRPAGDDAALVRHRVPEALHDELRDLSGDQAANIDQSSIPRMIAKMTQSEADPAAVVRPLLAWLGTATWPAEAIAGDGELARRLLAELGSSTVERVLPGLSDPSEVMGGVVWATHQPDDAASVVALGPAIRRILSR